MALARFSNMCEDDFSYADSWRLGKNPRLERKARSVGSERDEIFVLANDAHAGFDFLADNVAKNAAFFIHVILLGAFEFFASRAGNNRQGDQLRVRMLEGRAGGLAMILENQNVSEAPVLSQIENAVAERPQDVFDALGRKASPAWRCDRAFR